MSFSFFMTSNGPANRGSSLLSGPLLKLEPCSLSTRSPTLNIVMSVGTLDLFFSSISVRDYFQVCVCDG